MNPHCKLNSNVSYVSWKSSQNPSKDKKIPDVFKLNEPFPKTTNNYGWNNSPCHLEASKSSRMKTHPAAPVVNPHALVALEKNGLKLTFKYLQWGCCLKLGSMFSRVIVAITFTTNKSIQIYDATWNPLHSNSFLFSEDWALLNHQGVAMNRQTYGIRVDTRGTTGGIRHGEGPRPCWDTSK